MRRLLAAVLFAASAVAAPGDKHDVTSPTVAPENVRSHGPGRAGGASRGPSVLPPRPQPLPQPGDRVRIDRHHHHGDYGGLFFYPYPPYPTTWPYPPYPYSQYYYPYPAYPYAPSYDDDVEPMPSTRGLVVPGELPMGTTAFWYYCDTPDGYYPYVKSCNREWTQIPISPPPPGVTTPLSYSDWQWCEETKSFFPYVSSCKAGFISVPVTAPGKDQAGPPSVANWFFCEEPKGWSPYVVQCKRDWRAVPAVPPPSVKISVRTDEKAKDEKSPKK